MDVKLNVRSVHFDADQKLVNFIQEKINKLAQIKGVAMLDPSMARAGMDK